MKTWRILLAATACITAACASVTNETFSTIILDGRSYELRTRTFDGPDGAYQTSSVRVNSNYYLCKPDSPGDCQAAVKRGRNGSADRS